jgi:putative FmdB family regulatory protein
MPIYEFECSNCNKVFEKICHKTDVSQDICPECGEVSKKIISAPNFRCNKYAYKPLKKSRPKSYVPTLHDLKLDPESKKKRAKEMR